MKKRRVRAKRDTKAIAKRLHSRLEEIYGRLDDINLARIAKERGFVVRTFQYHINGQKDIGINTLMDYAEEFGVGLDYLLTGITTSQGTPPGMLQPPINYRYVPLLSEAAIAGARTKDEVAAAKLDKRVLVSADNGLGRDVFAFEAPDNSMVAPQFNPDTCITEGEQAIIDIESTPAPGKTVCAVLFNPLRIVLRVYGVTRQGGATITRLVPLNPLFGDELIQSPADGFVFGVVDRVQAVRHLSKRRG